MAKSTKYILPLIPIGFLLFLLLSVICFFLFFSPFNSRSYGVRIDSPQIEVIAVELIFSNAPSTFAKASSNLTVFTFKDKVALKHVVIHLLTGNHLDISSIEIKNNEGLIVSIDASEIVSNVSEASNNVIHVDLDRSQAKVEFKTNGEPLSSNYLKLQPLNTFFFTYDKLRLIITSILTLLLGLVILKYHKFGFKIDVTYAPSLIILLFFLTFLLKPSWNNIPLVLLYLMAIIYLARLRNIQSIITVFYFTIFFYLLYIIGLFYTAYFDSGLKLLETGLPFILMPLVFSIIILKIDHVNFIFKGTYYVIATLISICLTSLLYNLLVFDYSLENYFSNLKPFSEFLFSWTNGGHPSYFFIAVLVSTIYQFELSKRGEIPWIQVILLNVLLVSYIAFSGVRIGYILYPLIVFVSILHKRTGSKKMYFCVIGFGTLISSLIVTFFPSTIKQIDLARYNMWSVALSAIKEHPFIGNGTGGSRILENSGSWLVSVENPYLYNVHNQYLDFFLQFGFLGPVVLSLFFSYLILVSSWREDYITFSISLAIVVFSVFENVFERSYGVGIILVALCLSKTFEKITKPIS